MCTHDGQITSQLDLEPHQYLEGSCDLENKASCLSFCVSFATAAANATTNCPCLKYKQEDKKPAMIFSNAVHILSVYEGPTVG